MSCLSRMSNGSAICSSTLPLQGSVVCNFDTVVLLKINSSQLETKSCSTRFSGISPDLGEDCYAVERTYLSNRSSFYTANRCPSFQPPERVLYTAVVACPPAWRGQTGSDLVI